MLLNSKTAPDTQSRPVTNNDSHIAVLLLSLADGCNLCCFHCSEKAGKLTNKSFMEPQVFQKALSEGVDCGVERIVLFGGEPTLNKRIVTYSEEVVSRNLKCSISTNGTVFRKNLFDHCIQHNDLVAVQVSLDGTREVHDRIRGRDGVFAKTLRTIKYLKEGDAKVSIAYTLHDLNYDCLVDIYKLARDLEVPLGICLVSPMGRGAALEPISVEKIVKVIRFVKLARSAGTDISIKYMPSIGSERVRSGVSPACGWGRHLLGISADGSLYLCIVGPRTDEILGGNIMKTSLRKIIQDLNNAVGKARSYQTAELKGVCGICYARDICGGGCRVLAHEAYGDLKAPFPLCQHLYEEGYFDGQTPVLDKMQLTM